MPDYTNPGRRELTLNVERVGLRRHLTREFLQRVTAEAWPDHAVDGMVVALHADVMSERLPDARYRLTVTDPRWATWRDHLKATVAQRWWARWWVSRHPPRTVDTPIAAEFDVRSAWRYPDTPHLRPGLGSPVVWTYTTPVDDPAADPDGP